LPFPWEHFIKWTVYVYTGLRVGVCDEGQGFRIDVIERAIVAGWLAGEVHEGA